MTLTTKFSMVHCFSCFYPLWLCINPQKLGLNCLTVCVLSLWLVCCLQCSCQETVAAASGENSIPHILVRDPSHSCTLWVIQDIKLYAHTKALCEVESESRKTFWASGPKSSKTHFLVVKKKQKEAELLGRWLHPLKESEPPWTSFKASVFFFNYFCNYLY